MADNAQDKPRRSAADKERSRQQSRPVSAREAARTVGQSGRAGQRQQQRQRVNQRPQGAQRAPSGQRQQQRQRANQRPQTGRQAAGRRRPGATPLRRGAGRSRSSLVIWGSIAAVIVVVVVLVVVNVSSKPSTTATTVTPEPVPATVLSKVTHVKPAVYDAVGAGAGVTITKPGVLSGQPPLRFTGKPGFFYMGGEYCPFCAAERWAIITSLSRFGTFENVETMQSSPIDVDPRTQTFTFAKATYTSPYFVAKLVEHFAQDKPTGRHPVLEKLTKTESQLASKYGSTSGSISVPFIDIGNKEIVSGASYSPTLLQGLTRAQIAADLSNPKNPVTQSIIGVSNYISASICSIDGGKPGSVCSSPGVKAAAKAIGISP